jgi:hypothetical protein
MILAVKAEDLEEAAIKARAVRITRRVKSLIVLE